MSKDKEKQEQKNSNAKGGNSPYSSKNVHSEQDNSTKDGIKINSSDKKKS